MKKHDNTSIFGYHFKPQKKKNNKNKRLELPPDVLKLIIMQLRNDILKLGVELKQSKIKTQQLKCVLEEYCDTVIRSSEFTRIDFPVICSGCFLITGEEGWTECDMCHKYFCEDCFNVNLGDDNTTDKHNLHDDEIDVCYNCSSK